MTAPQGSVSWQAAGAQSAPSNDLADDLVVAGNSSLDAAPTEPAGKTVQTPVVEGRHIQVKQVVELNRAQVESVAEDVAADRAANPSPEWSAAEPIDQRAQSSLSPPPPVIPSDRVEPAVFNQEIPPAWKTLLPLGNTPRNPASKPFTAPLTEFPPAQTARQQEISTRLDVFVPEWGQTSKRRELAQVILQTESVWVAPREGWVPLPNDEDEAQDSAQARREWERRIRLDREQRGS
jgi:hypothetical protein